MSPLVAGFFATRDFREPAGDGCIWALDPVPLNVNQGFEPYLYPLNAETLLPLLRPARYGLAEETGKVAAAIPIEKDLRMLMQQGGFTIHSSRQPLDQVSGSREWLRQILIPAQSKAEIALHLDIMGIRSADLFPDLTSLAEEAMEQYKPR